jgi:DNA-binding LacI/PurR family transcriptional regulator
MGVMKQERRGSSSITIADIARLANTSKATVSRVLNGNMKVRPEMRERIVSVIEEYGFTPNRYARCLAGVPTHMIGVVVSELANFFFTEVVEGIDSVLSQHDYSMLMSFSNWDAEKELRIVNMLIKNHVDGVILSATAPNSPAIAVLKAASIPFVVVNCIPDDPEVPYVCGDNYEGGRLVAEYLNGQDYGKVLVVTGFDDQPMKLRCQGFLDHLRVSYDIRHYENVPTAEEGRRFADTIVEEQRQNRGPVVVFVSNDNVAIGVENSIAKDVRIPEDVSIVGYDDILPASFCKVPLTTVSQDIFHMGSFAAELLVDLISRVEIEKQHILIAPKLVIRESTR